LFQEAITFIEHYMGQKPQSKYIFSEVLEEQDLDFNSFSTFQTLYMGFEANIVSGSPPDSCFFSSVDISDFQSASHLIMHDYENLKEMNSKSAKASVPQSKEKTKNKTQKNLVRKPTSVPKTVVINGNGGKQTLVQRIAPCAANYAAVLCNPWNFGIEACLPCDLLPLASNKNCAFTRTTLTVGTGGIGYIWIRPVAVNDQWSVAFSNSVSSPALGSALSSAISSIAYLANCPYTSAQFGNEEVSARNTAFGVRIKYTGELMNRNGVVYSFEHPDRLDLSSWTFQEVIDSNFCRQQAVLGKNWDAAVCCSGPVAPSNLEYTSDIYQGTPGVWIGVIITGKPGDTYMVDYANRTEYLGSSISQKTMSHPAGSQYGSVIAAAKDQVLSTGPLRPTDAPSMFDKVKSFIGENLPFIVEGGRALGGLVSSMVTGNPAGAIMAAGAVSNLLSPTHNVPKLLNHQIHSVRQKEQHLGTPYVFLPFDPLVQKMFDWRVGKFTDVDNYMFFHGSPKSEMFARPVYPRLWSELGDDEELFAMLRTVNNLSIAMCNDGEISVATYTEWFDRASELLAAYFNDDVPPKLTPEGCKNAVPVMVDGSEGKYVISPEMRATLSDEEFSAIQKQVMEDYNSPSEVARRAARSEEYARQQERWRNDQLVAETELLAAKMLELKKK
jgi:hypothetical protein